MHKIILSALLASFIFANTDTNTTSVLDEEGKVQATISHDEDGYFVTCGESYQYVGSDEPYETLSDATEAVTSDCEPIEE